MYSVRIIVKPLGPSYLLIPIQGVINYKLGPRTYLVQDPETDGIVAIVNAVDFVPESKIEVIVYDKVNAMANGKLTDAEMKGDLEVPMLTDVIGPKSQSPQSADSDDEEPIADTSHVDSLDFVRSLLNLPPGHHLTFESDSDVCTDSSEPEFVTGEQIEQILREK